MNIIILYAVFWLSLVVSLRLAYLMFRDIADITQFWMTPDRKKIMTTWYRRKPYMAVSTAGLLVAVFVYSSYELGYDQGYGAAYQWILALSVLTWLLFVVGGYFNPGWMMRTMQKTGNFVSVEEAREFIHRDHEVLVIEHNGKARAHTDYELWRPHVVGTEDGLSGENIVMSYCAMTNLGMAFRPEIEGKPVDLKVMTQLENNLVMWDKNTEEPIQQIWGTPECNGKFGAGMPEYPLFKMPFEKFAQAYPDGQVFHRRRVLMKENPFIAVYDKFWEAQFYMAVSRQKQEAAPVFPTLKHEDNRLYPKEHVWGVNIDNDAVCYSIPFVKEQGGMINTRIQERDIIVHWDEEYESLGIWYNDTNKSVSTIDFFGKSDLGIHQRVESVKAGLFYAMWFNFFPTTDVNRV